MNQILNPLKLSTDITRELEAPSKRGCKMLSRHRGQVNPSSILIANLSRIWWVWCKQSSALRLNYTSILIVIKRQMDRSPYVDWATPFYTVCLVLMCCTESKSVEITFISGWLLLSSQFLFEWLYFCFKCFQSWQQCSQRIFRVLS